jgi:hypothetical protein
LCRSAHPSIDAFLESVPEWASLGKFLIAQNLKRCEDVDRLFPPNDSGWYAYLFNALLTDGGAPAFADSNVGIITFNYDRSLEAYLHEALQARFGMAPDEALGIVQDLPILHVHGSLGEYPAIPYQASRDFEELVALSQSIQIVHELPDDDEHFCNPMFKRGHQMLLSAERVFFLGFGFHPDNLRRFRFFSPESTRGKTIRATVPGIGGQHWRNLAARLSESGISFPRDPSACNGFFHRSVTL